MKSIFPYYILMMVLFTSCENGSHASEQKIHETTRVLKEPEKKTLDIDTSAQQHIAELSTGKDTLRLSLEMQAGEHVTIPLDVFSGDSLFAQLNSDDKSANIRFTQIAKPDQTFDGPFGQELIYSVKKPGRYALIIGQNMMAGDPWEGKFRLKVWVK